MTRLTVDIAKVAEYSQYLTQMKSEIDSSKDSLIASIESIKGSWKGTDSDTFVANATAYIENLGVISGLLETFGGIVGQKATKYAKAIENFYAGL